MKRQYIQEPSTSGATDVQKIYKRTLSKLPCFCPIGVGNHTYSNHVQTYTRIEKTTPQKVSMTFYTPLRRSRNQYRDFYRFFQYESCFEKVDSQ